MFGDLPLHPAIVHLPIGIMFLLPIVTIFVALLIVRGKITIQALSLLVLIHLVLVGASYAALETGEDEEHKVEKVVSESLIESHEERAEIFMIGTVILFTISLSLLFLGTGFLAKPAISVLLVGQLILLVLGYRVGHSGGELVYVHGASQAYMNNQRTLNKPHEPTGAEKSEKSEGIEDE